MMHGHLPYLISRIAPVLRHVTHFYHSATRMVELGLYSLQMPRRESERRRCLRRQRSSGRRRGRNAARPPRPLLIHYHIFKNAGTSFEWALAESLGRRLHIYDASAPDGVLAPEDLAAYAMRTPQVQVIFSHQAVLPPPRMRRRALLSSILVRDPIARIRSIYAFERLQPHSTQGAMKAKEMSFKNYVEWRLSCSPNMFCNYQVYFCSRTTVSKHNEQTTEEHLQRAIANLDLVDVVGTVERYSDWLALAQAVLAEYFPKLRLKVRRENTTAPSGDITHRKILNDLLGDLGSALAERLLECNKLDMRLHQVADALLTRRLAEEHVDVALLNAYAEANRELSAKSAKGEHG